MSYTDKLEALRRRIDESLLPLFKGREDCAYLDLPFHTNLGDLLIWMGTQSFLDIHGIKCTYSDSLQTNHNPKIKKGQLILLHGGGNFGDVWRDHQEYRCEIISKYKDHDIVILPQTVYYDNEQLMEEDSEIFALHPNLTICARDQWSYDYLKAHFSANHVLLVPDMAFCILKPKIDVEKSNNILCVSRLDHELSAGTENDFMQYLQTELGKGISVEISDWPTILQDYKKAFSKYYKWSFMKKFHALFVNPERCVYDQYVMNWFLYGWLTKWSQKVGFRLDRFINWWMCTHFLNPIWQIGNEYVRGNKLVITNRLHVCILCTLLEEECRLFDNNYGKNSHFYDTWLTNFYRNILLIRK